MLLFTPKLFLAKPSQNVCHEKEHWAVGRRQRICRLIVADLIWFSGASSLFFSLPCALVPGSDHERLWNSKQHSLVFLVWKTVCVWRLTIGCGVDLLESCGIKAQSQIAELCVSPIINDWLGVSACRQSHRRANKHHIIKLCWQGG